MCKQILRKESRMQIWTVFITCAIHIKASKLSNRYGFTYVEELFCNFSSTHTHTHLAHESFSILLFQSIVCVWYKHNNAQLIFFLLSFNEQRAVSLEQHTCRRLSSHKSSLFKIKLAKTFKKTTTTKQTTKKIVANKINPNNTCLHWSFQFTKTRVKQLQNAERRLVMIEVAEKTTQFISN